MERSTSARPTKTGYLKGYWSLVATQFQGAFNDNLFKFLIIFFLLRLNTAGSTGTPDPETADRVSSTATILFSLPFIFFPGIFGALSDRFSKKRVTVWTKYLEVVIMIFGCVAFYLKAPAMLWVMLFMMSTQSAIFSPSKYGILPEMLPEERLSWGNGILAMSTIVAILSATPLAGFLRDQLGDQIYLGGVLLIALSCVGILTSYGVTNTPAANPRQPIPWNPWKGMGRDFKVMWGDRWLLLTVVGIVFFWFAGALLQQTVIKHAAVTLALNDTRSSILQTCLALGIGLGSVGAGFLSRGKIEVGLIPMGALGLAVCSALLGWPGFGYHGAMALLFGIGFFAGFYDVPLAATLQQRSPDHMKGSIIATSNMLTFLGMAAAGGLFFVLGKAGISTRGIFLITGLLSLGVGIYICALLPVFLIRFVLWILANTIYRVEVRGRQNIPDKGGALLVANHTSFLDALAIAASTDRNVRFVMFQGYYELPWIHPIAKMMGAIPINSSGGARELVESMRAATHAIEAGEVVCIFAEGQITRTGQLLSFKKGFERIIRGVDAPIIPVHLDRLWGSIFSFAQGRFFWKWPSRIPYPITVSYGEAMAPTSSAYEVRQAVQLLSSEAYAARKLDQPLLHRAFIRTARRYPRSLAMADGLVPKMTYRHALIGSIVFAGKLRRLLGRQPMTGVLLPPAVGGALTNIALLLMGKTVVNLNYTASKESIQSSAEQCGITQVITSRAFLEKLPVHVPGAPIYLEDLKKSITATDRLIGLIKSLLWPMRWLERGAGARQRGSQDDLATIIFSSGSEGKPKGVMLSHFNISSNIEAAMQVFPITRADCFMGILPFFHSFGYMGTLWLPLTRGLSAVYHPSPMDAKVLGALVCKYKATFLISTPTFLQNYIRRCNPEEFGSLKYVVTGAEKLPARIREAFNEKFGVEPLEGYGTTECSPAVAINTPNFRAPGFFQVGTKHGTIGRAIPGVSVRVVDPETGAELPDDTPGMLQVKGPNIMQGYLGQPEKTAAVLKDGWYTTGDIAAIDEEGFITITDRLSRFSKIAGEMVPHTTIEETFHRLLGLTDQTLAVAGVPDVQKGERLVVLHMLSEEQLETLLSKIDSSDLPNLWRPKSNAFYRIDQIPLLGTGKMDLQAVKTLARSLDLGE